MSYFDDVVEPAILNGNWGLKQKYKKPFRPTTSNNEVWQTLDGDRLLMRDMTDSHLENAFNHIGRKIGTSGERPQDVKVLGLLMSEKNRRKQLAKANKQD